MSRPAFVAALLFAASSAFPVEIEFSSPRSGPAAYDQSNPVVASNGADYLVAWTTQTTFLDRSMHVYAAEVRADGTLAAEIATQLDAGASDKQAFGVSLSPARDGYFAAWNTDTGMTAAVLDSSGRVERTAHVTHPMSSWGTNTLTAWDGSTHLVLSGLLQGYRYSAALLDDNANIIASDLPVSSQISEPVPLALIVDGAGFLVLSTRPASGGNPDTILGRRIAASGSLGVWFPIKTTTSYITSLTAVHDGARDLLVWSDSSGIWIGDFDPQTNTLGVSRKVFSSPSATSLRVARANGRTWIVWTDSSTLISTGMSLNEDGTAAMETAIGQTASGRSGSPIDLATNGQSVLSVRSSGSNAVTLGNLDVLGRFLSPTGGDFVAAKSLTDQEHGALAVDGTAVLATWDEGNGTTREIYAARHIRGGASLDGAGVQVSSGGTNWFPSAAWNGSSWLIAWLRRTPDGRFATVARRFSADGALIDSEDIALGPASENYLRVASDGSKWAVAWIGPTLTPMVGRVSGDGRVLDPEGVDFTHRKVPNAWHQGTGDIDIAWDGVRYVAAWAESVSYDYYAATALHWVRAALISADLSQAQLITLREDYLTRAESVSAPRFPRVAAIANNAVVAWDRGALTQYVVLGEPRADGSRSRAVGGPRITHTLDGSLLGVSAAATGHFVLHTIAKIPGADANGVFSTTIDARGPVIGSALGAILDGSEPLGNVVRSDGYAFIAASRFDPAGGAMRQWMTIIDSPH